MVGGWYDDEIVLSWDYETHKLEPTLTRCGEWVCHGLEAYYVSFLTLALQVPAHDKTKYIVWDIKLFTSSGVGVMVA